MYGTQKFFTVCAAFRPIVEELLYQTFFPADETNLNASLSVVLINIERRKSIALIFLQILLYTYQVFVFPVNKKQRKKIVISYFN